MTSTAPGTLPWTWLGATIDLPDECFGIGKAFWGAVTGYRPNLPSDHDPNYALLQPQVGTPHLWLQRLMDGEPSVHLDLHVGPSDGTRVDLAAAAEHAVRCGAEVVSHTTHLVLRSPGGTPFCLIPDTNPVPPVPAAPGEWEGGSSRVDQVCLDIAAEAWEPEIAFWGALTGWPVTGDGQWARLWTPAAWPLRVLLQRRGVGETAAHLDVSCDNREAEAARWIALGARVIGQGPRWAILETPGELTTCLTARQPSTGRLEADVPPSDAP